MTTLPHLIANWPAPPNVSALTTTRLNGASLAPFDKNNLGLHVGDNPVHVEQNRQHLVQSLCLPNPPAWLEQTHSNHCVMVEEDSGRIADAAISRSYSHPLAIMTADCLPILLCNQAGTEIAAIHAGWRGLLNGIVENTINKMHASVDTLLAWIGPAICHKCYQTGLEVQEAYLTRYPFTTRAFYTEQSKWHANLPLLAELILKHAGISSVYQSNACTFEQENRFYSYRKHAQTGRIATLIWFNKPQQQDQNE
jgi:polyphenol oxidase